MMSYAGWARLFLQNALFLFGCHRKRMRADSDRVSPAKKLWLTPESRGFSPVAESAGSEKHNQRTLDTCKSVKIDRKSFSQRLN